MGKPVFPKKLQKEYKSLINQVVRDFADVEVFIISPSTIVDCPNCFEADTLVETPDGLRYIDAISPGDLVYNGEGDVAKVNHVFCRHTTTDFVTVKTHGNNIGVTATSNHKLPVYKNEGSIYSPIVGEVEEKEIKDIKPGDLIAKGLISLPEEDLDYIYPEWDINKYGPKKTLPEKIEVTDNFLFAIGLFIAEGCTSKRRQIQYCLNQNELDEGYSVCEYWKSLLDVNYSLHGRGDSKNAVFEIYSSHLARFLDSFCGHLAQNKVIPKELYGKLSKRQTLKLLEGYYFGDGHEDTAGTAWVCATVSHKLAYQVYSLLLSCGLSASIKKTESKVGNDDILRQDSYFVRYFKIKDLRGSVLESDRFYTVVKSVEVDNRHSEVYNFEVDGVHSYIANGVSVNNCIYDNVTGKSAGIFDSNFVAPVVIFAGTDSERTITPTNFTRGRCPICYNEGVLEAFVSTRIRASIDIYPEELRAKTEEYEVTPYGKDGKTYCIFKTHEKHYDLMLNCLYMDFNGVRYEKVRPPVHDGIGLKALTICWFVQVETDAGIG